MRGVLVLGLGLAFGGQAWAGDCASHQARAIQAAFIEAGSVQLCPTFPKLRPLEVYVAVQGRMPAEARECRAQIEQAIAKVDALKGRADFCELASQSRNGGIGTNVAEADLANKLEASIKPPDALIAMWVDKTSPCGMIAIVAAKSGAIAQAICADGSLAARKVLAAVPPPPGAKRAWQTPGLKRRPLTVLGMATHEYVDAKGGRHDLDRYVELKTGELAVYQDGIGVDDADKPYMTARRISP